MQNVLTEGDGWHYVNSPNQTCFRYRIEPASEQLTHEEEEQAADKEAAMSLKIQQNIPASLDFELPPSKFNFRMHIFGTIDKLTNFEAPFL